MMTSHFLSHNASVANTAIGVVLATASRSTFQYTKQYRHSNMANDLAYKTNDIFKTSTGVGHHFRPGYYFPSASFQTLIREPLPPGLAKKDEVPNDEKYPTTTGKVHDRKFPNPTGIYGNDYGIHKKAPGSWKVHYVKDLSEKLGKGGWRKPLTMGNQSSEMMDKYKAEPGIKMDFEFDPRPQDFILKNHHKNGPSKQMVPSTQNDKLRGKTFMPKDKGVLNLHDDMYLTTTNKDHRPFNPRELKGYSKKDVPTYWECEEYPKAWGHGLKHNPLPKDSVPRERPPMRDTMVFPSATRIPRLPNSMKPVPHSGLKTLQKDSYMKPSDVKARDIFFCPVETPYSLPNAGPKSIMTSPGMYKTEYTNVGSGAPITV
ncbi:unnamed protein product [Owenia fusiformis]|uniref:Uncharacterized protein n=1 Tax=Owenia fusiformis TaxID=6347 RepID=A0A8J1TXX0_OWEFU|nr:unnamed protein product [Owenia fusiformis]